MTRAIALALVIVGTGAPRSGAAQGEIELVRRASGLAAQGDHRGAVRVLRRAQIESPSALVDVNLASSLAALGELREARRILRRVIEGGANPLVVDAARDQLRTIEMELPTLTIEVDARAAELRVDDERPMYVDGSAVRLELDPGDHQVRVVARDGAVVAETAITLTRGERASIDLREPAPPSAPRIPRVSARELPAPSPRPALASPHLLLSAEPCPPPPAGGGDDALVWVLGAGGAAAAIALVVTSVMLAQPHSTTGDVPPIVIGGP